ncbi:hypothetical protein WHR41_03874 [Cladosporium halotolerans]|uniref:Pentatricopeptide repeat protein n=1 Tax=Cladosporium halotolerans TaxID=1052096 RepID=A0AB34KQE1_9PEZI
MQTLWTRIAQSGGGAGSACKCPQCLSFAGGLTKRVGSAAARRPQKYLTSSTLWYSGIFAAAATLDASVKLQRRERWDRAIAEVKKELGKEETAGAVKEDQVKGGAVEDEADVLYSLGALEEALGGVGSSFKTQRWPANTGPPLQEYNLAPESVYAGRTKKHKGEFRAWTPKKIEIISLSVDILQLRILISLVKGGYGEEAARAVPEGYGAMFSRSLESLYEHKQMLWADLRRVTHAPPTLEGYERTASLQALNLFGAVEVNGQPFESPRELNTKLHSLMKEHKRQNISTPALLARICYDLSSTPTPPNLDTFNTLLVGLSAANQTHAVSHVIRSLNMCNLRPNETSIAAILNHYTATDDAPAFLKFVETMRGKHRGLALARPDIRITAASNGRLVPSESDPTKIIQLPYPTPKVFAALIAGVVKFSGFDAALQVCQSLGEQGWGLCMNGLAPLLADCAERRDQESGLEVWRQVKWLEKKARSQRMDGGGRGADVEQVPVGVYVAMLRLCLRTGDKNLYDEVWEQASRSHRTSAAAIVRMVKEQMREEEKPVDITAEAKRSLDHEAASEVETAVESPGLDERVEGNVAAARIYPQSNVMRELRSTRRRPEHVPPDRRYEVLQGQLHGSLPASAELEEYEVAERPMYASG